MAVAKYPKPALCHGCPLEARGVGFVPAVGPVSSPIVLLGEAPGYDEAATGVPFYGAAGGMLSKILGKLGWTRDQFRLANVLSCTPPGFDMKAAGRGTITHCARHRDPVLFREGHQVIVAMGASAIKTALGLWDYPAKRGIRVEDFHGTVQYLPSGHAVVCTFHPSHLQRGAHNLIGTVAFDLTVAMEVAQGQWQHDSITSIIDPPIAWFRRWVDDRLAELRQDPEAYWGPVDIETPDKAGGRDEGELSAEDTSYIIERVNLSANLHDGITVPYSGAYIPEIKRYLAGLPTWIVHNGDYDLPRLLKEGIVPPGRVLDSMWLWHFLQPDVPRGLGFAAPFFSQHGAWKHLASQAPGEYASYDGPQTGRVIYGVAEALVQEQRWAWAERHCVDLMQQILKPAQVVGIQVDRPALDAFEAKLTTEAGRLYEQMQTRIPEALRPLTPKDGLTRAPAAGTIHAKGTTRTRTGAEKADAADMDPLKLQLYAEHAVVVERQVVRTVLVCQTCGEAEVQQRHRCKDAAGKPLTDHQPQILPEDREVTRWFWQEPFNPDSVPQVLAYVKTRGHKPGTNKHTKKDAVDRETLQRLARETKDPLYADLLALRAVTKVRGTYAIGVRKRLDPDNRFHPHPTLKPSTMRTCVATGTLIEVVRDVSQWPDGIPIEQVRAGDLVYSYDTERRLVLRPVRWAGQTGVRDVVRVHWESGWGCRRRTGYVDVTPDHEMRRYDGTWCPAAALKTNERLMALTRGVTQGYARLWPSAGKEITREHRFIWEQLCGTAPEVVHHKNGNKLDNRFGNLAGMSKFTHGDLHGPEQWTPTRRAQQAAVGRRGRGRSLRGGYRLALTKEQLETMLASHDWKPTALRDVYGIDYETAQRYLQRFGIDWREQQRLAGGRDYTRNHRVVAVEPLSTPTPVYDLEVEETHNFIAGEVCVHNSYQAPNIQNVVSDKGGKESLAAGFRRCIVASQAPPPWLTPEEIAAYEAEAAE